MRFLDGKLPQEKIEINTSRNDKKDGFSMISTFEVSKHVNKVLNSFDYDLTHAAQGE